MLIKIFISKGVLKNYKDVWPISHVFSFKSNKLYKKLECAEKKIIK